MRSIFICSDGLEEMMSSAPESCVGRHRVGSLREMRDVLASLPTAEAAHSLDLMGHSTRDMHLLRFGKTVVDMADVRIATFFDTLRREHLGRLRIEAVRLLGCETAVTIVGQRTMRALARTLGVRVLGSRKPLYKTHYAPDGFCPAFQTALIEATELPNPPARLG